MELTMPVALLVFAASVVMIKKGADFLVDGSADMAKKLHVSPIVIGLTVLAVGTSLPEFVVSLIAVLNNNFGIAVGNVIGSNIANIGLILGLAALVFPLKVQSRTLTYEFPFLLLSSFLLVVLANDAYIWRKSTFSIDWIDGIVFMVLLAVFIFYLAKTIREKKDPALPELEYREEARNATWKNILLIVAGIAFLSGGGKLFVSSGSSIARMLGVSEAVIGLTIVSLGTSVPELSTALVAAWKKHADMAIGTVVGSNIFNVVTVLGIPSFIRTITVDAKVVLIDGPIMLVFTMIFLLFATTHKRISRWEGLSLFFMYLAYIAFVAYQAMA